MERATTVLLHIAYYIIVNKYHFFRSCRLLCVAFTHQVKTVKFLVNTVLLFLPGCFLTEIVWREYASKMTASAILNLWQKLSTLPIQPSLRFSVGQVFFWRICRFTTLCPKKTCDYIFYNNFNNRCPITIIFGIVSSKSMRHRKMVSFPTSPI